MADRARNPEITRLVREFQIILEHYDQFCTTEADKQQYVEAIEGGLFDITKVYTEKGFGCPPGQVECPGGGCVQRGRVCPDIRVRRG